MKHILCALLLSLPPALAVGQEPFPLGGRVHDPRPPELLNIVPPPPLTALALPSKVDLSADLPPVGMQTGNSCTGWSVGYYFKTHQEKAEHGWDLADPGHQFSPMFLYNQLNEGVDGGADLFDALELMWPHGCATVSRMPSNAHFTDWPSETAFDSALLYRCHQGGYPWFSFGSDAGIAYAKQLLSENKCVVFNIGVFHNFDHINSYDTVYCAADSSGTNRGGHNLCLVGYDDDKATRDGIGAFRAVNSWGTGWGNKGYWWLSYQMVKGHPRMVYPWAGYVPDRVGYQPALKARVRVSHARRGRIEMIAGVGSASAPLWSKTFYVVGNSQGQYWGTGGDLPFPATDMVLDLTEGAAFLDSATSNDVFFGCIDKGDDGVSGSIEYAAFEHLPWGATAVSAETPRLIPGYNSHAYCFAQIVKPSGASGGPAAPKAIARLRVTAFPSPARRGCTISLAGTDRAAARVSVYDAAGRLVRLLRSGPAASDVAWDLCDESGRATAAGVYLIRATDGERTGTARLLVVR